MLLFIRIIGLASLIGVAYCVSTHSYVLAVLGSGAFLMCENSFSVLAATEREATKIIKAIEGEHKQ